ncbi:uncharacterized protein LOC131164187 [Malania oleifera]|uniref:uncharacterized protein LOC131164187 n=1 Tax=Malania oleifera TaxID=397392 RepID=UPI0025AE38D6|nr:uncharacterized protein LOC131164187 [Malania oleifera]
MSPPIADHNSVVIRENNDITMPFLENFPTAGSPIGPLLLRNLVTSVFVSADTSLLNFAEKHNLHRLYKLFQLFQHLLLSSFLFFLGILPSFFSVFALWLEGFATNYKPPKLNNSYVPISDGGDSGIARALTQLLCLASEIPVCSRKYEFVQSLAERLIDENHREGFEALRELNRRVLSAAFAKTLSRLEVAASEQERERGAACSWFGLGDRSLGRVYRAVRGVGQVAFSRFGLSREEADRGESSAEKMAAELLWLSQKMAGCGIVEEAVSRWAAATNLASLALSAEPRLQGSLVKVSAFLMKQIKTIEGATDEEGKKKGERSEMETRLLMGWVPLLCRASNGTDAPVLSSAEKAELERVLEDTIANLGQEEQQEKVLSHWLYHFTSTPNSDWPNLQTSYARWCTHSRKLFLLK